MIKQKEDDNKYTANKGINTIIAFRKKKKKSKFLFPDLRFRHLLPPLCL